MAISNSVLVDNIVNAVKTRATNSQAILKCCSYKLSKENIDALKKKDGIVILMPVTKYTSFSEIRLSFDLAVGSEASGTLGIFYYSENKYVREAPSLLMGRILVNEKDQTCVDLPVLLGNKKDIVLFPQRSGLKYLAKDSVERRVGETIGDYFLSDDKIPKFPLFLGFVTYVPIQEPIESGWFNAIFTDEEG